MTKLSLFPKMVTLACPYNMVRTAIINSKERLSADPKSKMIWEALEKKLNNPKADQNMQDQAAVKYLIDNSRNESNPDRKPYFEAASLISKEIVSRCRREFGLPLSPSKEESKATMEKYNIILRNECLRVAFDDDFKIPLVLHHSGIGFSPVTEGQFQAYLKAAGKPDLRGKKFHPNYFIPSHPYVFSLYKESCDFCDFLHVRLPSGTELSHQLEEESAIRLPVFPSYNAVHLFEWTQSNATYVNGKLAIPDEETSYTTNYSERLLVGSGNLFHAESTNAIPKRYSNFGFRIMADYDLMTHLLHPDRVWPCIL